ncbi:hypothetical protein ONE63_004382 [Megalurothrips usitatus]|uniref:Uncharacterized protein n=1 Tax=Megalurothrips usitatus TaxID=439358 RepID=A0AAV7X6K0_9NEOP|nr:hypothetical protein ONE63_004382 [Megalurothrips usitatus]
MVRLESPDGGPQGPRRPVTRSQAARRRPAGSSPSPHGPHGSHHGIGLSPSGGPRASSQQDVVKALVDSLDDATLAELPGLPGAPAGRRRSQRRGLDGVVDGSATLGHPWRGGGGGAGLGGSLSRKQCGVSISDGNVSVDGELPYSVSRFSHRTFPKETAWYPGDELGTLWHQQPPRGGPGGPGPHQDHYAYRNRSAGASPHYHGHHYHLQDEVLSSVDNLIVGNGVHGANGGVTDRCWLIGYPRHCASEVNVVSWNSDRLPHPAPGVKHPPPTSPANGVAGGPGCSGRAGLWENLEVADGEDSDSAVHDDLHHPHRGKRGGGGRAACPYQCRCPCDHRDAASPGQSLGALGALGALGQTLAPAAFTQLGRTLCPCRTLGVPREKER